MNRKLIEQLRRRVQDAREDREKVLLTPDEADALLDVATEWVNR